MKIKGNKLIVKVRLEGRKFYTLENALIDSGSAFTVISPGIADYLQLETFYKWPKISLITASGLIEPSVKVMEGIVVGKIRIKKLPVVIHEIPDPAPIKILLGMNFVQKLNLQINGKKRNFNISDP